MPLLSHNHSRYSVLFVDDEEKSLKYFKQAYGRHFNILTASDCDEAKKLLNLNSDNIGILIADKRMPTENGIELLEWTKKQKPNIIRILTTAYSDNQETIEAINKGHIFRYVQKPWQIEHLLNDLKNAMNLFMQQKLDKKRVEKCVRSSATLSAYFANKLQSPLRDINNTAKDIHTELLPLIETLKRTQKKGTSDLQLEKLRTMPKSLQTSVKSANTEIDSLLVNIYREKISAKDIIPFSIQCCTNSTIAHCLTNKHLKQRIYFYPELDFIVSGIEDLVKFVLFNLLNNAIDAISENNTGEIFIRLELGKHYNYVYIKDTGTGIADNILPYIFDEYFSTKPAHKGLGLSFCKKIMEELGGGIQCHAQKSFYTEFSLRFPKVIMLSPSKLKTKH